MKAKAAFGPDRPDRKPDKRFSAGNFKRSGSAGRREGGKGARIMAHIDFSPDRFQRIREVYADWWAGKGTRPVSGAIIRNRPPKGRVPKVGLPRQGNISLKVDPDDWLDAIEYEYSQYSFYGDAFPVYNLDIFGPGVLAEFLGAELENDTGLVWFHPKEDYDIRTLNFEPREDSPWLSYILEFCRRGWERFGGQLLLSMPDLGGVLDVLSTFFPAERLLFELYDHPEDVKRLSGQIARLWKGCYDRIAEALHSREVGFTDWSMIYSDRPSYIIQCDFCYMIGNDMFKEFVLPDLTAQCRYLDNTIYHLDGPGELNHLQDILAMPDLNAVQWVLGTGPEPCFDNQERVFSAIAEAGKGVMIYGYEAVDYYAALTGKPGLILQTQHVLPADRENDARGWLKKWGIER